MRSGSATRLSYLRAGFEFDQRVASARRSLKATAAGAAGGAGGAGHPGGVSAHLRRGSTKLARGRHGSEPTTPVVKLGWRSGGLAHRSGPAKRQRR